MSCCLLRETETSACLWGYVAMFVIECAQHASRNAFVHTRVSEHTCCVQRRERKRICLCLRWEHLNSGAFCCSSDSPVSWILMPCSLVLSSQACVISPFSMLISLECRDSCGSSGCNGYMVDTEDMCIYRQTEILYWGSCWIAFLMGIDDTFMTEKSDINMLQSPSVLCSKNTVDFLINLLNQIFIIFLLLAQVPREMERRSHKQLIEFVI